MMLLIIIEIASELTENFSLAFHVRGFNAAANPPGRIPCQMVALFTGVYPCSKI